MIRGAGAGVPTTHLHAAITSMEVAPTGKIVAVTDADDRTIIVGAL